MFVQLNAVAVAASDSGDDDSDDDVVIGSSHSAVRSNTVSKSGKTSYSCVTGTL